MPLTDKELTDAVMKLSEGVGEIKTMVSEIHTTVSGDMGLVQSHKALKRDVVSLQQWRWYITGAIAVLGLVLTIFLSVNKSQSASKQSNTEQTERK